MSSTMTAPNGPSQQMVVNTALQEARLQAAEAPPGVCPPSLALRLVVVVVVLLVLVLLALDPPPPPPPPPWFPSSSFCSSSFPSSSQSSTSRPSPRPPRPRPRPPRSSFALVALVIDVVVVPIAAPRSSTWSATAPERLLATPSSSARSAPSTPGAWARWSPPPPRAGERRELADAPWVTTTDTHADAQHTLRAMQHLTTLSRRTTFDTADRALRIARSTLRTACCAPHSALSPHLPAHLSVQRT